MGFLKKVGKKLGKGVKKLGKGLEKAAKKVAPIAIPILAGMATGGLGAGAIGGLTMSGMTKTAAYALGGGLLASKLLKKKGGKDESARGEPDVTQPGFDDPAGVGEEIKPLAMPSMDTAAVEEARLLALRKRQAAGGRRSTILANIKY